MLNIQLLIKIMSISMKFFMSKQFWILNTLLLGFIFLQILDFPQPFDFPWIFGIGKFLIFVSIPIYISRFDKKRKHKIAISLSYLILIISTYSIPFWKLKANIYLSSIQNDYSQIVEILEKKGHFTIITYKKQGDSLQTNPRDFKSNFSTKELNSIKNFMKDNYYSEIFDERNGIALIYRRFLDNRNGFILCDNQECRARMDSVNLNNEDYYRFNDSWYHFSAR
jgi:hypothetical protein